VAGMTNYDTVSWGEMGHAVILQSLVNMRF
jgi:hypothetical protein